MSKTQKELGLFLRQTREEKGISLDKLASKTSIRKLYLEAIEEGTIETMLSTVYARGFVLQVASFLGVAENEIVKDHAFCSDKTSPSSFHYGIGTLEIRSNAFRNRQAKSSSKTFWIAALLLFALFTALLYWEWI